MAVEQQTAATSPSIITLAEMRALVGKPLGRSPWMLVGQPRIDAFAEVTEDRQFIHVNPERAKAETPFGGTVAHGFLTLSLLVRMAEFTVPRLVGAPPVINFGLDKMRFLMPVKAGQKVRGRFNLAELNERTPGQIRFRYSVAVEIEGEERKALVAHWLTMVLTDSKAFL
ncbi:MAG: MaoC family dehydratase [Rhodospirillales bacterium]|nr:MaoC family dehydratase [Rhodospirillales bacterium]